MNQLILDRLMADNLHAKRETGSHSFDYFTDNHDDIFEVRLRRQGIRDVRDAMLQMASYLGSSKKRVNRAFILISLTKSSPQRILGEWNAAKSVIVPDIARRLFLIAIVDGKTVVQPPDSEMQSMASKFHIVAAQAERGPWSDNEPENLWPRIATARQIITSWKHLEIEKILVHRWLLQEGSIGIGIIKTKVGCSYPTVREATKEMIKEGVVRTGAAGVLELVKYPRERWSALITATNRIYVPREYVNVTGESDSAALLLKRLHHLRKQPDGVAIGGVAAARHWNRNFDLNGTPRVDLVIHVPSGQFPQVDGKFIQQLDPALQERKGENLRRSAVLVVHPIHRQDPLFSQDSEQTLPWADPVETILHLNDMGLTAQAGDLISKLRSNSPALERKK